jgi:16S rRNA (cytidine1402-2'-O)-methyltransferase
MAGILFLVATPIGNLADLSARAVETLRKASFIVCEDTRHSRVLLSHYGISKETVSMPGFAERQRAAHILERISAGEDCALITDAGSPGISDPGEALVSGAVELGIQITPIPGPSAAVAALTASGLPTARFHFLGFLPRKRAEREQVLSEVEGLQATLVVYESAQRLLDSLRDLHSVLGPRRACVARELTKVHEELVRGTLPELVARYEGREVLGEIVIVVEGRTGAAPWSEQEIRSALAEGLDRGEPLKAVSKDLAKRSGWSARDLYRIGLSLNRS